MSRFFARLMLPFKWISKIFHILRLILSTAIFLSLITLAIFLFKGEESYDLAPNSVLKIALEGDIVEERTIPSSILSFAGNYLGENERRETLIQDITLAIDTAKNDPKITLIVLDTSKMGTIGLDHIRLIGKKINQFQKSGKKVLCLQDTYLQKQYYLASYADTIAINPMGFVALTGFAHHKLYFKEVIEKLRVDYNVFIVGQYKSALEPFTRTSMSSQDRLQTQQWMSSLWQTVQNDITQERHLQPNALYNYTQNAPALLQHAQGSTALLAQESGLVDHIFTRQQMKEFLQEESNNSTSIVSLYNYLTVIDTIKPEEQEHIAIIVAEGNIVPGTQPPGTIGAESLIASIRQASQDDTVKGLILRINSGGGSAFASELIRQELLEFKRSGKPYYVSMGRLAASGAYWISADADEIWASPTTITGSIGIFGAIPTFERSLASIGIYSDGETTSPIAGASNITRGLSSDSKNLIQQSIEYGYRQFINIVADGRKLDKETVINIAGGRVYAGVDAKKIGLIDNIGDLEDTISALAERVNLTQHNVRYIQKSTDMRQQLLEVFSTKILSQSVDTLMGKNTNILNTIWEQSSLFKQAPDPSGVYAYGGEYLF